MSTLTLDGRIKVKYHSYSKHLETIHSGVTKIGAAKIWYSKPPQTYYLLVSMESLTNIRERTNPQKKGKKVSKKQRRANYNRDQWSFTERQGFIDYKAILAGSLAVKVDANYMSQAWWLCP